MNSNSTPFKKRNNPFADVGSTVTQQQPAPTPVQTVETPVRVIETPVQVVETPVQVVQKTVSKPVTQVKKVIDDANREKYTATMEKTLRKRVKIAAATAGIQVSTFIEEACLEKLEREGL